MNEQGYLSKKYVKEQQAKRTAHKEIKRLNKQHTDDLDIIATLTNENLELGKIVKDYQDRYTKECYNVVINNGYVTELIELPAYREYMPVQSIEGYDMNKIKQNIKTALYTKIPYVYVEDRQLKIDSTQYKKFKLGGII